MQGGNAKAVGFSRWSQTGVFDKIFQILSEDADMGFLVMGGSVIKSHQHAARCRQKNNRTEDEGLGRSSGGLSSKIHGLAEGLGNPVDFILTGGAVHDSQCADALLQKIARMEAMAVIPLKANRKEPRDFDRHYYKDRNLIECFFVD